MTLYQLIDIAFEELTLAIHGTSTPGFFTPIQEFIDETKKWRGDTSDLASIEEPASYWHRKSDKSDKIIQSCLNFLRKITPKEILPDQAKDRLTFLQIGAITLLRTFFSEQVQQCPRISKRVDNLEALFIMNELLQSFTSGIGYSCQIILDMFPIEFIDALLEKRVDELYFEWFVRTQQSAYSPTEKIKQLKEKVAARIETETGGEESDIK